MGIDPSQLAQAGQWVCRAIALHKRGRRDTELFHLTVSGRGLRVGGIYVTSAQ